MRPGPLRRLLAVPLRAPRLTLTVVLVATAALIPLAASIRVDSSIENLLPADDPEKRYYDAAAAVFGNEEIAVIGVFAEDVFAPATLAKIARLSARLLEIDGVREVMSLSTVKSLAMGDFGLSTGRLMREVPRTAEEAAALRARALAEPLYVKNIVSADGRAAGISVVFESMHDEEFLRRGIEGRIRTVVAEFEGPERFAITGVPTLKVNGARLMEGDIAMFMPLSILVVVGVLIGAFRTPRGVLMPLAAVLIGLVWTLAVMVLAGKAINIGTLVLPPLLMVVGVASGIHVVSQYYLELEPGRSRDEVVAATMDHVRLPVAIAAATTLIGFATLIWTPIQAIRDFGMFSVLGIVVIVLASFSVIPAALALLPLPRQAEAHAAETERLSGWLLRIGAFSIRHRRAVLVLGALVCGLSVWGITRLQVETDYLGFFSATSSIRTDNALISSRLAGTQPIYVVIDGDEPGSVTRLETLAALGDLQAFIDRQPGVDKTLSLLDSLRTIRRVLRPDAAGTLLESQSEVEQMLLLIDPADIQAVVNPDRSRANIIVRTTLSRSVDVGDFVERVKAFAAARFPRQVSVRPTGTVVLLNRSADALAWGQVTGLWQELVVLLLLLSGLFLSFRVGFLALIPNVTPTVVLFGIMAWSGISLNVSTAMIAAIAIGIAIDDTIHLLSGFGAELRKTGSQEQAILNAMKSVGQAAVFISVALAAGFLVVCLSNFKPVQHFGVLSAATMGVALVTELFLTPALFTTTKVITLWDLLFLKLGPDPHLQVPLFAGLGAFQAKIVVLMARLASAARGAFITRRGETRAEMYVLLNGRAEVQRAEGGRIIRSLGRGDVVGEMGLVRGQPRSADVVVVEDTDYLVVDARFLQRLRRRYPRIAATVFLNLARILSDRLEHTTSDLSEVEPSAAGPTPARAAGIQETS